MYNARMNILRYIFSTPKARQRHQESFFDWAETKLQECIEEVRTSLPHSAGPDIYGPIAWALFYERYM